MLGFVSVGYTPQTTDISVCCQHVDNVSPTHWQHSVKPAFFFANKVVSGNCIPDTLFYLKVGVGTIHFWYVLCLPCMQELDFLLRRTFCEGHTTIFWSTQPEKMLSGLVALHSFARSTHHKKMFLYSWRFMSHHHPACRCRQRIQVHLVRRQFLNVQLFQQFFAHQSRVLALPWPHPPGFAVNAP